MSENAQPDDVYAAVPDHMRAFIREMDTYRPKLDGEEDEGQRQVWERFEQGRCMACGGQLAQYTTLILNAHGICAAFCSGVCTTDMHLIGWLQEQHDDLIDRLTFRGGLSDGEEG